MYRSFITTQIVIVEHEHEHEYFHRSFCLLLHSHVARPNHDQMTIETRSKTKRILFSTVFIVIAKL